MATIDLAPRALVLLASLIATGCAASDPGMTPGQSNPEQSSAPAQTDPHSSSNQNDRGDHDRGAGDPFADGFVDAHNVERGRVSPAANPALPSVRWDPKLAATAAAWAGRCEFEHSRTDYGENLSARTDDAPPATIVAAWAEEAQHYDHRRARCASGEVCGHYTQVVWRTTTAIGCGVARCDNAGPFGGGPWFMWVCNYDPAGNWNDERPY